LRWIGVVPPGRRMRPLIECPQWYEFATELASEGLGAQCELRIDFPACSDIWPESATGRRSRPGRHRRSWRVRMPTLQPDVATEGPRISHDERIDDPDTGVRLSVHGSRSCAGRTARRLSLILRRWKRCDAEGVGPHKHVVATDDVSVRRRAPGPDRRGTVDALVDRRLVDEELEVLTGIPVGGGQLHVPAELAFLTRPHRSCRDRTLALDGGDARGPIAADPVSEMMRLGEVGERRRSLGRDRLG